MPELVVLLQLHCQLQITRFIFGDTLVCSATHGQGGCAANKIRLKTIILESSKPNLIFFFPHLSIKFCDHCNGKNN